MGDQTYSEVQNWRLEQDAAGIAWLCLDCPDSSTNTLSATVMSELDAVLSGLASKPPAGLVIYSGKERGFIAGADIREFPALARSGRVEALTRQGQQILGRLEQLPCPSVAVINGFALGGGLELALACGARLAIATEEPTIGLPEVQLGLHPGFGGTVRAVQLAGSRAALKLMMTGKPVTPAAARAQGLVDEVVAAGAWRDAAMALLKRQPLQRRIPLLDRFLALGWVRPRLARKLATETAKRAPREHYPAPWAILELWEKHGGAADPAAFEAEASSFAALAVTPASSNLVRVYFLQERLKHLAPKLPSLQRVHVVGAGLMGGDIAAWCALRGLEVTLQDREERFIQPAIERAGKLFSRRLGSDEARATARSRLRADVQGEGVAGADIIIEAIYEDLSAKQTLLEQLEPRMKSGALLVSNTSSIPLQELAAVLRQPERLTGLHFFNPVARLPLVEVVMSPLGSEAIHDQVTAFARQIGKLPLPCRSQPGFLVNRILAPYLGEAMELAREGVPLAEIDLAATAFGMPMGPVQLADSVGLDVALQVARMLAPLTGRTVAPELEALVEAGHLGVKSGRGFYTYDKKNPVKPRLDEQQYSAEVQDRLILSLLNEAAACLHENIVSDSDLIDAGVIFGTGFAPFRGGPMHYARQRGIDGIVARLDELTARHGLRFRPSAGWQELQAEREA